jgi:glycosyltransferase involved in cell wall biosynthesis
VHPRLVVGRLDPWFLQEGPERFVALQKLLAGTHRLGPWRWLATLTAQIDHPQQCGVGLEADRSAALLQMWPGDRAITPVVDINLVIVGKEGWTDLPVSARRDIPLTLKLLRNHPELNRHLYWLEGISDEYLDKIYAASMCLIAASYGEGFGLPLIEAARHNLPIIARDIPVFREVAGDHAYYFNSPDTQGLAQAIKQWLTLHREGLHPQDGQHAVVDLEAKRRYFERIRC